MERIMIAIPCGDFVDTSFCESLIHLKAPKGTEISINFASGSLIYDARNGLSRAAVDNHFDYIMWLDSDMTFAPDLIERLYEDIKGREMVCGMFFSRRPPFKPPVYSKCGVKNNEDGSMDLLAERVKPIPGTIFEVEACGFAAVLMRTNLVGEIFEKGGLPFSPLLGFGEDLSACIRFVELGHHIHCDPTIIVGHTAKIIIGGDDYRTSWNEGEAK